VVPKVSVLVRTQTGPRNGALYKYIDKGIYKGKVSAPKKKIARVSPCSYIRIFLKQP
jgi:hypothetical protein